MPCHRKQGFSAPICVSQNYLTSSGTINNVLKRTGITKNDHVLEIGPGKGHITRALLRRCGRVTAVELDGELYRSLREKFDGVKNLRLIHMDFLKFKLPGNGNYKVFANIPFNHTTSILRKLTECPTPPEEIWLVVEKGAAKRFMGKQRENLRSLLLKPYYDVDIIFYFQRDDFHPKPGVDVVLLHLERKSIPDIGENNRQAYRRFIEGSLSLGIRKLLTPKQLSHALKLVGQPSDFTPAHLLYVQWLCLFRCWRKFQLP